MARTITSSELVDDIEFTNEHEPWEEAQEVHVSTESISSWDNPFKISVNGQLVWSGKSRTTATRKVNELIERFNLRANQ